MPKLIMFIGAVLTGCEFDSFSRNGSRRVGSRKAISTTCPIVTMSKRLMTMKLMMLGVVLAIMGASVELLAQEAIANPNAAGVAVLINPVVPMSDQQKILWGMIAGSLGLLSYIGLYDVWSPRMIARHALASIPIAGFAGPVVCYILVYLFGKYVGVTETGLILQIFVSFVLSLAGPYAVRKYGQPALDAAGEGAIEQLKNALNQSGFNRKT